MFDAQILMVNDGEKKNGYRLVGQVKKKLVDYQGIITFLGYPMKEAWVNVGEYMWILYIYIYDNMYLYIYDHICLYTYICLYIYVYPYMS